MAGLRDSSGQIVIDEHEAAADVRNIDEARAKLAEARRMLDPSKLDDSRMLGMTRDALSALLEKACKDLDGREAKCDQTKDFINKTVAHYQRIDRELSASMRGRS
jgi:hypothetical protein